MPDSSVSIFFASPLEPEHVARIQSVSPRLQLLVPDDLWPEVRYVADHHGEPRVLSAAQEARWLELLRQAEVCWDFDRRHPERLCELAPRLRWIQATSSGVVHYVAQSGVDRASIVVTTASGIHAIPLAEWTLSAVLWHEKRYPHLANLRGARHWERFCGGEAYGKVACIVGYGQVGRMIGRYLEAIGVAVYGVNSSGLVAVPTLDDTDVSMAARAEPAMETGVAAALDELLPVTDYLIIAAPGTLANHHLMDERRLSQLPERALLVNVGRGSLVDEAALVQRLSSGGLAAAALDVFREEPLPPSSPLWDMPNVLINPHSASTSHRENERITGIFCDNLERYLAGHFLRNVYRPGRGY